MPLQHHRDPIPAHLEQFAEEGDEVGPFTDTVEGLQRPVNELAELGPFPAGLGIQGCRTTKRVSASQRGILMQVLNHTLLIDSAVE